MSQTDSTAALSDLPETLTTPPDSSPHARFCDEIVACYRPANRLEAQLAHSIAGDHWRLNRLRDIEEGMFSVCDPDTNGDFTQTEAQTFLSKQTDFKFLSVCELRIQRSLNRNKAELRQLQSTRRKLEAEPPCPDPKEFAPNGLDFSNPDPTQAAAPALEPPRPEPKRTHTAVLGRGSAASRPEAPITPTLPIPLPDPAARLATLLAPPG